MVSMLAYFCFLEQLNLTWLACWPTVMVSQMWDSNPNISTSGSCCLVRMMTIREELMAQNPDDPYIAILKHGVWRIKGIIQVYISSSIIVIFFFFVGLIAGMHQLKDWLLTGKAWVHFIVAACENMISGTGMRPGDILTASNGKTIEICDAVVVAKILNATLVIPFLEENPVWKDSSSFEEIFDVDHFISVLKYDIRIVQELPKEYSWSTREYYAVAIRATRVKTAPVHASPNWYLENVLPVLQSYGIAAISPFSHRLAFDNLPEDIQRLRCKVNFQALTFVPHINALGETLIKRLRHSVHSHVGAGGGYLREIVDETLDRGTGKFVVLHLRFDKDMAAHSACDFGGGKAEKLALAKYRQVIWQGRVMNSQFTDEELRGQGRCPLTPEEIGLLLAALGFDSSTRLYLASHKVYGGEARISALRKLFPLMEDKKSLASKEELAKVDGKASLLAAIDYYVSMQSDVFISASPGNMHNAMVGHRTYENLKTIRPSMTLLGQLFLNKSLTWPEFERAVQQGHRSRQGQIRLRKPKQSIYTYPAPDCMCGA